MIKSNSDIEDETDRNTITEQFFSYDNTGSENSRKRLENPKKSLKSSKKTSFQSFSRPKSSKLSTNTLRTKEEIEALSIETSKKVIQSIYSIMYPKVPSSKILSELSEQDQQDIQNFFSKKKTEFDQLLEEISKYNKKPLKRDSSSLLKTERLQEKRYINEILLIKKKQKLLKNELIKKASERIKAQKKMIKKNKEIEANKIQRESKKIQEYQKNLIIQNIDNFYKDKIAIIKDRIQKELISKKINEYDHKNYVSSILKQQRESRIQEFYNIKTKYEKEIEDLRHKFNSI